MCWPFAIYSIGLEKTCFNFILKYYCPQDWHLFFQYIKKTSDGRDLVDLGSNQDPWAAVVARGKSQSVKFEGSKIKKKRKKKVHASVFYHFRSYLNTQNMFSFSDYLLSFSLTRMREAVFSILTLLKFTFAAVQMPSHIWLFMTPWTAAL